MCTGFNPYKSLSIAFIQKRSNLLFNFLRKTKTKIRIKLDTNKSRCASNNGINSNQLQSAQKKTYLLIKNLTV